MPTVSVGNMIVSGHTDAKTFAVYEGSACLMRGRFIDNEMWIDPGSTGFLTSELAEAITAVVTPPAPPPEPEPEPEPAPDPQPE